MSDITKLDFLQMKQEVKDFLSSQDQFTDYNFEGSNMNVFLDVLTFYAQKLAMTAHLASNETFLESAQVRGNIVSIAKMLGYTPHSRSLSKAYVNISIPSPVGSPLPQFLTLESGLRLLTSVDNTDYQFITNERRTSAISLDNSFTFSNVQIIQGKKKVISYRYDAREDKPKFLIPDIEVDISTINVKVKENDLSQTSESYTQYKTLSDLDTDTQIYFIEESYAGYYQIYFGDNILGKKPSNNNIIEIEYVYGDGESANGAKIFSMSDEIEGNSSIIIETLQDSFGGLPAETKESIKYNAPLVFSAQNRAVTEQDYIGLISQGFPNIESISVWGGEYQDPPQYGDVFICIKPKNGISLDPSDESFIRDQILKGKNVVSISPQFVSPTFTNIEINCSFKYNNNQTTKSLSQLQSVVRSTIVDYSDNTLSKFDGVFRLSNLSSLIDKSDTSIISNINRIFMYKNISLSNTANNYIQMEFSNPILSTSGTDPILKSSPIVIGGVTYFLGDSPSNESNQRNIYLYKLVNGVPQSVNDDIGKIYLDTGKIEINGIRPDEITELTITVIPNSDDLFPNRDQLLQIGSITATGEIDTIVTGGTSGAVNYVTTPRSRL